MTRKEILDIFQKSGAIHEDGHYVLVSGAHSDIFLDAERIYKNTNTANLSLLCEMMAEEFAPKEKDGNKINVVVGPEKGGEPLAKYTAMHLGVLQKEAVNFVIARKTKDKSFSIAEKDLKLCENRNILIVDDILTAGTTIAKLLKILKTSYMPSVGVLWNRGRVTPETLDVRKLYSLISIPVQTYTEEECLNSGLCFKKVPLNTDLGKGEEFLARHQSGLFEI